MACNLWPKTVNMHGNMKLWKDTVIQCFEVLSLNVTLDCHIYSDEEMKLLQCSSHAFQFGQERTLCTKDSHIMSDRTPSGPP